MVRDLTAEPSETPSGTAPVSAVSPKGKHRIGGLDALRGLAALSVLLGHYTANYHRLYGHTDQLLFTYPWAGYGVTLFFMISGFVILMTAERAARPIDFAWARFSRLYPAYWAAIFITFTVLTVFALPGRQPTLPRAIVNLTMFQNLLGVGNVDGVYWTLHVELYFYAIMFALLWFKQVRLTEFVLLGLAALNVGNALFLAGATNPWLERLRHVLILDHAFAFLIGVILYRSLKSPRRWHPLAIVACLAGELVAGTHVDAAVSTALAGLMFLTTRGRLRFLESRGLVFLGTISYSLYLTHQNIGYVVIRAGYRLGLNPNLSIALATGVALLIAVGVTFLVERPAMAFLRDRRPKWLTRPAPSPAPRPTQPSGFAAAA